MDLLELAKKVNKHLNGKEVKARYGTLEKLECIEIRVTPLIGCIILGFYPQLFSKGEYSEEMYYTQNELVERLEGLLEV